MHIRLLFPNLNESHKLLSELESKGVVFHKQSQRLSFLLLIYIQQDGLFYTTNDKIFINFLFLICEIF